MKYFCLVLLLVFLTGCASRPFEEQLADTAIEAITGKDYSRNSSSCPSVERSCGKDGDYQEWYRENGKLACACNN